MRDGLGQDEDFYDEQNIVGCSDLPYCLRGLVIKKILDIKFFGTSKMLFGNIFEPAFYKPEVLNKVLKTINDQLGLNSNHQIVKLHQHDYEQLIRGYYLRYSPDILTNYYIMENKTTAIHVNEWKQSKDNKASRATHQVSQLNAYLGKYRIRLGFLLRINIRAFLSTISTKNSYWQKLKNEYQNFVPWSYNLSMYKASKQRAKTALEHIRDKKFKDLKGPEFEDECEKCDIFVRKECGREEYKCQACKKKTLYEYPEEITSAFSNRALCQTCFEKESPHSKYLKYKLLNYKEI